MTDELGTARTRRRGAGVAARATVSTEERLMELEDRLRDLEGSPGLRERGRSMMGRVIPAEASKHFRNAGREQLLGVRSIVDFWIRRLDDAEERAARHPGERETIPID
jgi:hypothetical protein